MYKSLVSIIVPMYNVEKYLDRCLTSIKNQSYSNIEVLLINDGSTDDTEKIAKQYAETDKRFVYFFKSNGGLGSARNAGLDRATGDFVAFVDSDDFISEDFVKILMNAFDDDTDVTIGDFAFYDVLYNIAYTHSGTGREAKRIKLEQNFSDVILDLLRHGSYYMPTWKNMYRKIVIDDLGIRFTNERLVYMEDQIFNLQVYTNSRAICMISDIVCYHTIVPGSLSQGYRPKMFEMLKERYRMTCDILKNSKYYYLLEQYEESIPETIIDAVVMLCRCDLREAAQNIRNVLEDTFYKEKTKGNIIYHRKIFSVIHAVIEKTPPMMAAFLIKKMLWIRKLMRRYEKKKLI
jgi:glycosyltransferase involved in cell wall biosynthesis